MASTRPRAFWGLVVAAALLPAAAEAQNPYRLRPGATGKVCLDCHGDFEDVMKRRSVHSPVRAGECSDCHNPHASSHGALLASDTGSICTDCHADLIPDATLSVHQAVVTEGCATCHDPHASDHPNNLVAAGNELCQRCHQDLAAEIAGHEFQHSPVGKSCLTCHDPHASSRSEFLLKKAGGELCADCHDPRRSTFVERHMGYPVGQARCTSCHDPHGSDTSGILLAKVHAPVTRKMCDQCHAGPGSSPALALKVPEQQLCRGCHSEVVNDTLAHNRVHWPAAAGGGCLTCHSPHASTESGLLVEPPKALCGECHREVIERQEASLTQHTPVADGDCTACHAPHAADNLFLLASADVRQVCGECHDWQTHSSHPIGPEIADPRNPNLIVDCTSCHEPHGSGFKALSHLDPGGALCVQCHETFSR